MQVYNYSDIYLTPRYSQLRSRSEADTSIIFLGRKWSGNWCPANMESVINLDIAKWCSFNNYFYIYHRFHGATKQLLQKARAESWPYISISIGVKEEDKQLIQDIKESKCRVDCITIDIAHFDSINGKEMAEFVKKELPNVKLIGGNVATRTAVNNARLWGCDGVKAGVGGGGICSTKNMTGFHVPMLTTAAKCSRELGMDIIFDGGVRENADIIKATWASLNSQYKENIFKSSYQEKPISEYPLRIPVIMCGGLIAACVDAAGENIYENSSCAITDIGVFENKGKITHKRYWGSSSVKQKDGERKNIEGFEVKIPCNGLTVKEKYQEIRESVQSAISYSGGCDLFALKDVEAIFMK
jgi:GMP reductase